MITMMVKLNELRTRVGAFSRRHSFMTVVRRACIQTCRCICIQLFSYSVIHSFIHTYLYVYYLFLSQDLLVWRAHTGIS